MKKNYQKKTTGAVTGDELVLPDTVAVTMAEIGGAVKEGLLALAVATGLQVMGAMMEESVTALAGPKGRHQPDRRAVRHGTEAGSVTLGGRRVPVRRPRVRAADGSGELARLSQVPRNSGQPPGETRLLLAIATGGIGSSLGHDPDGDNRLSLLRAIDIIIRMGSEH